MKRFLACCSLLWGVGLLPAPATAVSRVNIPDTGTAAISWTGTVTERDNYADIRFGRTATHLNVYLHVFDRSLWYSPQPDAATLPQWDSATLLIGTDTAAYRFSGGLKWFENQALYESAYRDTGTGSWTPIPLSGFTQSGWRGNVPNDAGGDRGWTLAFSIPWETFGYAAAPQDGTLWKAGIILYDRDDQAGTAIAPQLWPAGLAESAPHTWNVLHFGLPVLPPSGQTGTIYILRHGISTVTDAHVGGHTECGNRAAPDYFPTWGSLSYPGFPQMAVQNQWDVADWPCFSKILLTFDLSALPAGKSVQQASLTLYQFGNADPALATPSFIQVLTAAPSWNEQTVTWNTAPPPLENIAVSKIDPVSGTIVWPGWKRDWNIGYGFAKTYALGEKTFSVILYSADGDYHSGKYFTSSDTGDWNATGRPAITVSLGNPASTTVGDFRIWQANYLTGNADGKDYAIWAANYAP